jgi:hypothetical protein
MIRKAVKPRVNNGSSSSRLRIAVAFIAGMAVTAALSQTPVAADIFSPRVIHESIAPALPATPDSPRNGGNPDTGNPIKPGLQKPFFAVAEEAVLSC